MLMAEVLKVELQERAPVGVTVVAPLVVDEATDQRPVLDVFVCDLFKIFRLASKIFVCLRVLIRHSSAIAGDMLSDPFGTAVCCCSGDVVGFRGRPRFRLIAGLSCCAVVTVTPFSLADVPDGSFS